MDNVVILGQEFKTMVEVQSFVQAQQRVITQLSKEKKELEDKVIHLELTLKRANLPTLESNLIQNEEDEETIARTQLRRLRDISMERDLTKEESQKFDIFYKVLSSIRNKPKTIEVVAKNLSNTQLLAALEQLEEPKKSDE
jgi:hypothetical protein